MRTHQTAGQTVFTGGLPPLGIIFSTHDAVEIADEPEQENEGGEYDQP